MADFKVGQRIRVVKCSQTYNTYDIWAKQYALSKWKRYYSPNNGDEGVVIAIGKHSFALSWVLLGVRSEDGTEYIIGANGVKIIEDRLPSFFTFKCASGVYDMHHVRGDKYICTGSGKKPLNKEYWNWKEHQIIRNLSSGDWKIIEQNKEEAMANGVDKDGNPMNFTKDMLKPFMRVVTKSEGNWMVVPNAYSEGELCVSRFNFKGGYGGWNHFYTPDSEEAKEDVRSYMPYAVVAIYAAPNNNNQVLNVEDLGELIWEYKSPEDLAANEALKVRKAYLQKQLEEVEENLASLKEELAALKGD